MSSKLLAVGLVSARPIGYTGLEAVGGWHPGPPAQTHSSTVREPTPPHCLPRSFDSWVLPWVFWFWAQFVLPASTWLLGECGAAALLLVLPAWAAIWVPACRRHFVR